ncbi:hypothetical protein [Noviherbaspirillum galbum]|uniref:Uncharacterized protein n=1 Tax=Noviherbaspirillum galbum TaxID=2709383 RepID=A0A6B3SQZ9_9BURK|nr:hypothetical protein [Noviherbaspirillum galbum]NEX63350.1 hypothetical protein [Noviherbaspirillum galbum]
MNNSNKVWSPKTVPNNLQTVLAVSAAWPLTPAQYRQAMAAKVERLFAAEPDHGRAALEMSDEGLPEMAAIARNQPPKDWPMAVMMSDSMMVLMNNIKWEKEGPTPILQLLHVRENLKDESLASLIEQM